MSSAIPPPQAGAVVRECIRAGFIIRDDGTASLPAPWGSAPRWKREAHGLPADAVDAIALEEAAKEHELERQDASIP